MTTRLRLAVTADLHWGIRPRGDEATRLMVSFLEADPPDVLVLAGDIGAGDDFGPCLALFDRLPSRKALVPGNHDLWVRADDPRGDSLRVYRDFLPALCAAHGFHYLDAEPLLLPDAGLALVGSVNWYDYSWSLDALRRLFPEEEGRLHTKRFTRGRHNDANYVRWPTDDAAFTADVVATLDGHLRSALAAVPRAVVVAHHPPFYGLSFPRPAPPVHLDGLLWDAFSGNRALEELLRRHEAQVAFAFCGHTHRQRENNLGAIRGYNVGGDYHFKRLLLLDWPGGNVETHTFGDPNL
jgi:3',5'-cyclic AMP phosphodiesterase CpdA